MKFVTLMGSPRSKGSTAAVLRMFEDAVTGEHEVAHFDVAQLDIIGCRGCYACAASLDEPGCVHDDDGLRVLNEIVSADAVVYATPLYMWGIASDLRALMERHVCLVKGYGTPACKSLVEGKRTALLVTCAGPLDGNADLVPTVFGRFASYARYGASLTYVLPGCTDSRPPGAEALKLADRMAREMIA